jgi:large conductance mechanosensitive channel
MKGFLEFVRAQGVVGLAVGFILGGAVSELVKSLIENIINPLIGLLLNQAQGLTQASFMLGSATIKYGALINTLINFCVIAAVVYFGVKQLGLDKLDKKAE